MNARTLEWISRMRTCNKAQWEIRHLVENMVDQVKEVNPLIGTTLGPSCQIERYCPEGKDSCKEREILFIIGPNGCGKSTLLKSIANLIEYRGTIKFDGVDSNKYERKSFSKFLFSRN